MATIIPTLGTVMVDFWASWCGPCVMLSPILDEIATENKQISLIKVDVESDPKIAEKYNVSSLPTVIIFKDGKIVANLSGSRPKSEYLKAIK
jgi:thioredoxin 1